MRVTLCYLKTKKDPNLLAAFAYTVDATGNRTAIDMQLNGTQNRLEYGFDDAYRLTNEVRKDAGGAVIENEAFTYDAVGNRLTKNKNGVLTTNTYNNANQLMTSVEGSVMKTYGYDANGNNISVSDSALNVTMTYDALNRQTSWTDGTNTEATLFRGASWHRTSLSANGNTTDFLYDGANVVGDVLAGGTVQKQYVTAGLDQNLSVTDIATANTYYYSQDGLNSVRTLTDASGVLQNNYDYTAFGEKYTANSAETIAQRYTYTGRETNPYQESMFFRIRNVSTQHGRFLSRAPEIWEPNKYEGHFFPNETDPYGLPFGAPTNHAVIDGGGGGNPETGGIIKGGTADDNINCLGAACELKVWVPWPTVLQEIEGEKREVFLTDFIPTGCRRVGCDNLSPTSTNCKCGEVEVIIHFMTRKKYTKGKDNEEFHAFGRNIKTKPTKKNPINWRSKMGGGNRIDEIKDPKISMRDISHKDIMKAEDEWNFDVKCFCCDDNGWDAYWQTMKEKKVVILKGTSNGKPFPPPKPKTEPK